MKKILYDAFYLIPLTMIPVLWAGAYVDSKAPLALLGFMAAMVAAVGILLIHLKAVGKIIVGAAAVSVAATGILLCPTDVRQSLFTDYFWVFILLAIAVITLLAGKMICSFSKSRIGLAIFLFAALVATLFTGYGPGKMCVALVLTFILFVLADELQIRWKKSGDTEHKSHLVFVAPFIAILFILLLVLPSPDRPYNWNFVRKIVAFAKDSYYKIERLLSSHEENYGDSFIGFTENSGLGAGVKSNDKAVMEVDVGTAPSARIYLAGKTFDTFTGTDWEKNYTEGANDVRMDSMETVYSMMTFSPKQYNDLYRDAYLEVRFLDTETVHAFIPYKVLNITEEGQDAALTDEGGDLVFNKKHGYDDSYKVRYFRINRDSEAYTQFALSDHPADPDTWKRTQQRFGVDGLEGYGLDDLNAYRSRIKKVYCPETEVSDRLAAYLEELMEGAENDQDRLQRIEDLLSGMKYTKSPGEMPADVDTTEEFLDYLIFEEQEGYCVYYATAFVLLARYEGIPTRYVQGFRVLPGDKTIVEVTENSAHAWPECYIDGVGWIAYEPTPKHKVLWRWKTSLDTAGGTGGTAGINAKEKNKENEEAGEESVKPGISVDWRIVVIPLGVAVVMAVILLAVAALVRRIRFDKLNVKDKFVRGLKYNMHVLKILGYSMEEGETLEEFRRRVENKLPKQVLSPLPVYEEYLYHNREIKETDTQSVLVAGGELYAMAKSKGLRTRILLLFAGR